LITFLIIEDRPGKCRNIENTLKGFDVDQNCIETADTIELALLKLEETTFDFVILDMMLPRSKTEPDVIKKGGTEVLDSIQFSYKHKTGQYKTPYTFLVLTESSEILSKYQVEDFNRCKVFAVHYQANSEDWKDEIKDEYDKLVAQQNAQASKFSDEKVIISIHGIRTFGQWQKKLGKAIEKLDLGGRGNGEYQNPAKAIEYKYNFFPFTSFLSKNKIESEIDRFAEMLLSTAKKHPRARISIVGHSFGTYLIFHALKKMRQKLDLDYLIFSGSVLQPNEKIEELFEHHNLTKVLNECSTLDLPLLAGYFFTNTYSIAGMHGITSLDNEVINRYTKGGHSSFFTDTILGEWSEFLFSGCIIEKDERRVGYSNEIMSMLTSNKRYFHMIYILPLIGMLLWNLFA